MWSDAWGPEEEGLRGSLLRLPGGSSPLALLHFLLLDVVETTIACMGSEISDLELEQLGWNVLSSV